MYDVELSNLLEWTPTENELRILSANMIKLAQKSYQFERLAVSEEFALNMFQDNKFKKEQVPNISQQSIGNIYKLVTLIQYFINLFYFVLFSAQKKYSLKTLKI